MSERHETSAQAPDPAGPPPVPGWVKLLAVAAAVIAIVIVVAVIAGGGGHGPGQHGL